MPYVLNSFPPAEEVLSMNTEALSRAHVAMEALVGGLQRMTSEGVAQVQARSRAQEELCLLNRDGALKRLVRSTA